MSTLTPSEDDGFTSVTYKKPSRAPKNRKGKNKYRERTLDEKLQAREEAMRRSGYIEACRRESRLSLHCIQGQLTRVESVEMLRNALSPLKEEENSASTSVCPPPTCVVCLGLGSVSDSTKAQDQYILLKELVLELGELVNFVPVVRYFARADSSRNRSTRHNSRYSSMIPCSLRKTKNFSARKVTKFCLQTYVLSLPLSRIESLIRFTLVSS